MPSAPSISRAEDLEDKMASSGKRVRVELPCGTKVEMEIAWQLYDDLQSSDPAVCKKAKDMLIEKARAAVTPSPPHPSTANEHELEDTIDDDLPDIDPVHDLHVNGRSNTCTGIFNRDHTLMLLSLYSEMKHKFSSAVYKKKTLWCEIARGINEQFKTSFTPSQVEGRWKTQLSAYRAYKDDQNKTGKGRKEFPYESQFEEILGERHDVEPTFLLESMPADSEESSSGSSSQNTGTSGEEKRKATSENGSEQKRKKTKTSTNDTIIFLESYVETQTKVNKEKADALERRHKEKNGSFSGNVEGY